MKNLLGAWALGALMLVSVPGARADADAPVSKDEALKAIEVFQKNPANADGVAASGTIMSFAHSSKAVRLYLSKDVVPWLKDKEASDADTRDMLLTAYVAGNVQAQLKSGKPVDDVYAGWQQVLATYAQLLSINPTAKISEVEELKGKEADGKLRAYADTIAAKQK